ncbi:hypothetical protein BDW75DRAFT_70143 [Aspergillus navahoensis]
MDYGLRMAIPTFFGRWSTCAILWIGSPKGNLLIAVGRGPCETSGGLVLRHNLDTSARSLPHRGKGLSKLLDTHPDDN